MIKTYYGYDEFLNDSKELCTQLKDQNFDAIVAIARGGLTLGHFLAQGLENRNIFSISSILYDDTKKREIQIINDIPDLSSFKKVLLVDDIVDSGETIKEVKTTLENKFSQLTIKTASLFYKTSAIISPDYKIKEANTWIEFFWEKDI